MSQRDLHLLDQSLEEANTWLKQIAEEMHGADRQTAYHALRGVLFALRDRIVVDEAMNLAAQLPLLVRGIYLEGYKPAGKPIRIRDRQAFLNPIVQELSMTGEERRVLDGFRAVLVVLGRHVSVGQLEQIREQMPEEIQGLWPDFAQETTTNMRSSVAAETSRKE